MLSLALADARSIELFKNSTTSQLFKTGPKDQFTDDKALVIDCQYLETTTDAIRKRILTIKQPVALLTWKTPSENIQLLNDFPSVSHLLIGPSKSFLDQYEVPQI